MFLNCGTFQMKPAEKKILVAPLNWGLGHAARCIPLVRELMANGFSPILASDGAALELLRKEFPELPCHELPSYNIEYPSDGKHLKWKLFASLPRILKVVYHERSLIKKWVNDEGLCGVISDNRFGVRDKRIPSVYITHQLTVLSGSTTWLTSFIHRLIIKKFDECWVPDMAGEQNLSGTLGHWNSNFPVRYIGPLTRMKKKELPPKYDIAIILSGPEPQRSIVERKLVEEFRDNPNKILLVRGVLNGERQIGQNFNIVTYDYMTSSELEDAINQSEVVICRSGYSTMMDLSALGKKAFFIPTPGQYEQEYLAEKMKSEGYAPYATQTEFNIEQLKELENYSGLPDIRTKTDWRTLFRLFERK